MKQPFGNLTSPLNSRAFISASNIQGGIINAQRIILAGEHGVLRSQNYDPTNETGWAVFGDGSASFYGDLIIGDNAIILGDLYSGNWNGTIPANLASVDGGATTGYYLDSSVGSAQFEGDIFVGGELRVFGEVFVGATTDSFVASVLATASGPSITYESGDGLTQYASILYGTHPTDGEMLHISADEVLRLESASQVELVGAVYFDTKVASGVSGTVTAPVYTWNFDLNTGIYWHAADVMGFAGGGTLGALIGGGGIQVADGTAAAPSLGFHQDSNIGLYRVSADTIGVSLAGALVSTLSAGQFLFPTGTATTSPGIAFQGDSNTGFYRYAADRIGVTTNGVYQAAFIDGGAESSFYIDRRITDIGNHETLRVNADSTAGLEAVGYYSSWAGGKKNIIPLLDSPRFPGLDIIDRISGVDFKRKSTKQREWGFVLDDFKELDDNLRYMTTKGDEWGYSPDEMAFIAVLWESNKDLRERVVALEARLDALS